MARRRVLALAGLTALGCLLSTGSTAAQTGPTPIDPAKALQAALSTGKVTGAHGEAAGWVLARNIVVTTSVAAPQLGDSAQFLAFGAAAPASCRIAASDSTVGVAVLRCVGVTAPPLRRATDDLTEGDPAVATRDRLVLTIANEADARGAPLLDQKGLVAAVVLDRSATRSSKPVAIKLRAISSVILDSEGLGESRLDAILRLARRYLAIPLAIAVVLGALTGWRSAEGSAWKRALGLGIFVVIVAVLFGGAAYLFTGDALLLP